MFENTNQEKKLNQIFANAELVRLFHPLEIWSEQKSSTFIGFVPNKFIMIIFCATTKRWSFFVVDFVTHVPKS
jgi:hypothetical protein